MPLVSFAPILQAPLPQPFEAAERAERTPAWATDGRDFVLHHWCLGGVGLDGNADAAVCRSLLEFWPLCSLVAPTRAISNAV